jgi:hypothetical protein
MLKALRTRLGSRDGDDTTPNDPAEIAARVDELMAANRGARSLERERELMRLRHRLGARLVDSERPVPEDARREFGDLDSEGLAAADAAELDGALVRGGILEHGYVLVRGLVGRDDALRMADRIEAAFSARENGTGEEGLYEEFMPERPYGPVAGRAWIQAGGGLLAADSPPLNFELIELFDRIGLRDVISQFLGEPATVSVQKTTLRRADPAPAGGWHQDGSFMGETRALNVWVALSDCGVDAPGLEFVPARIDDLLETGGEGSGVEGIEKPDIDGVTAHSVLIGTKTAADAGGEHGIVRPAFKAGDVMLFDDRFLHRTGSEPEMPNPRYAIESWFFGASGFPENYTPLSF